MSERNGKVGARLCLDRSRRARRCIGLFTLTVAISACAAPITVTRVNPKAVHQELTRNVLSAGEPSTFSSIILNRVDLQERFEDDPEGALRALHTEVAAGRRGIHQVFALAELSFLHAERGGGRPYYLAAAVYAYAFLFPPTGTAQPEPYDPRFRDACDLYNRGLTAALRSADGTQVELRAGVFPLPFGNMEVAFDPAQLQWVDRQMTDFVPIADLEVKGLRNRYRRPGLGAPLAASAPSSTVQEGLQVVPRLKVPATAFLRIEDPWEQLKSSRLRGTLELYVVFDTDVVEIGDHHVPLEAEPTAALAYMLSGSTAWDMELSGFLSGSILLQAGFRTQLLALEPYRPGRIPVVLVHGTASSPARWAEMLNELQNDPRIRQRYQFWSFFYETGNPVLYSALTLRESLEKALATLDHDGKDDALRRMVLIGHSQGGLLVKLMVVELEKQAREAFPVSIDDLRTSEENRDLLRRTFAVHPLPFVRRVIFLATPHRGSYVSGNWVVHQVGRLVTLPGTLLQLTQEVLTQDPRLAAAVQGRVGSVYGMTPGSPLVKTLAPAPLAPGVIGHSIIAVKGDGPPADGSDGVVKYTSAHLEAMASELVVNSDHSVQENPVAIEEVRRILLEHAEAR